MAAPVKLTKAEGLALAAELVAIVGAPDVAAALVSVIGAERATGIVERQEGRISKAETVALVKAILPLIPGANLKAKIKVAIAALRRAIPDRERQDAILAYVLQKIKDYKSPAPTPAAGTVPAWDACTHASCWGGATAERRAMNILSPTMPESRVKEYLDWQTGLGANTVHLILANHRDGEFGGYTIYGSTWGWQIHRPTVDLMLSRILECRRRGFAVVIWLITDDSAPYAAQLKNDPARYCRDVRDLGLLQHASIVCPALEKQDHFGSRKDVAALIAAVRSVWTGKVATHEVAGKTDFADLGDICFLQLYPNKSPAQVKAAVAAAVRSVGRPVNAFEISRNPAKALCDAAFDGGAIAVGNCDGGPGPFTSAPAQLPSAGATHLGDDVDLSKAVWHGPDGRGAKVTETLYNLTFDGKAFRYRQSAGTAKWTPRTGEKNVNQYACFFVKRNGVWAGGKFDWSSETRNSRERINIDNGYTGGIVPRPGEEVRFCLMDLNGTKRTNAPEVKWK